MRIILKGQPLSTNHIYRHAGKFTYMTAEGKSLKESYQWQAKVQCKQKMFASEIKVKIKLFFGDKRKRDIDNHNKIVLDSLTNIVWVDDSLIMELYIIKDYDKQDPRVELEIETVDKV